MSEIKRTCTLVKIRTPFIYRVYVCREGNKEWFEVQKSHRLEFEPRNLQSFDDYSKALDYYDTIK